MIEQTAIISKIANGQVWIKKSKGGACGGCIQQANCGAATLAKLLPKRELAVECNLPFRVGDQVRVAIDDSHLLWSALLLYLLPLLVMLAGVGLASALLPSSITDTWLPAIALAILLLAFWLIHRMQGFLLLNFCQTTPQITGSHRD